MQRESMEAQPPIEQIIEKLYNLNQYIEQNPHKHTDALKQYSTLYIENQRRSDEMFNILCEHNFIAKLFSGPSKTIEILEIFNLILANMGNMNELVYVFSHPLFHSFLLVDFNPLEQESTDSMEYYIQLLKTIVLKLQMDEKCSLLKLFCNSKYPTFPLLLNCIALAIKRNVKQELVRVTAQHCILQIIELVIRKRHGVFYLTSLHLIVLYYELIQQFVSEELKGEDNAIKYIIDLIRAVRESSRSLMLFFNIFANSLIFQFLENPGPALHMTFKLSNCLCQTEDLSEVSEKHLTPMYHLLSKYLFSKYINNVSLASVIILKGNTTTTNLPHPNIIKMVKFYHEKNKSLSEKVEGFSSSQMQAKQSKSAIFGSSKKSPQKSFNSEVKDNRSPMSESLLIMQAEFNDDLSDREKEKLLDSLKAYNQDHNSEFQVLKDGYLKPKKDTISWIYGTVMKKINYDYGSTDYAKKICVLATIQFQVTQEIAFLKDLYVPVSAYLAEFLRQENRNELRFGQSTEDTEYSDVNFNGIRDCLKLDATFLKALCNVLELVTCEIDSVDPRKDRYETMQQLERQYNSKLSHTGEVYFILHFKKYLEATFSELLCGKALHLTVPTIKYLHRICYELKPNISESDWSKLEIEVLNLTKELKFLVRQKGHQQLVQYLESGIEKKIVEYTEHSLENSQMFHNRSNHSLNKDMKKGSSGLKTSILRRFSIVTEYEQESNQPKVERNTIEKITAIKMLHLELLRFCLYESSRINFSKIKKPKPLYKIFEEKYLEKYQKQIRTDEPLLLIDSLTFESQQKEDCQLQIQCNLQRHCLDLCLLSKKDIFFRYKLREFQINEKKSDLENGRLSINGTEIFLGFGHKAKAAEFLENLQRIKFQNQQLLAMSIENYLQ